MDSGELQALVVELQSQVAFQEETIAQLNSALVLQQQDLARLQQHWDLLSKQYAELEERLAQAPAGEEMPPHY